MNQPAYFLSIFAAGMMVCSSGLPCKAASVEAGDTRKDVEEKLGRPQGTALAPGVDLWIYPRGEIEFQDGRVTRVTWVSENEFQAQQDGMRAQALQRKQAEEATAQALREEAEARKKEILNDPDYSLKTPSEQVAIWAEYYKAFPNEEKIQAQLEAQTALAEEAQNAENREAARADTATEADPPRLSGSKSRKARRGAGTVKPEDRPSFMTRQTLDVKASEKQPGFLSDQTVRTPARQKDPGYLSRQTLNIKSSSKKPSFLSDQTP